MLRLQQGGTGGSNKCCRDNSTDRNTNTHEAYFVQQRSSVEVHRLSDGVKPSVTVRGHDDGQQTGDAIHCFTHWCTYCDM